MFQPTTECVNSLTLDDVTGNVRSPMVAKAHSLHTSIGANACYRHVSYADKVVMYGCDGHDLQRFAMPTRHDKTYCKL